MEWQKQPAFATFAALEAAAKVEVAEAPHAPGCWISLISIQKKMGRVIEARQTLERAVAALPAGRDLLDLYLALGEDRRALALAEALIREAPEDAALREKLAQALVRTDRWEEAQQRAFAQLTRAEIELSLNQSWRRAEHEADFRAIAQRCRSRLAIDPIDTDARCFLAHALACLGESEAARETLALDRLVRVQPLPPAEGYASIEVFCAALTAEIVANRTLERDPADKATRDGLQTSSLGQPDEAAVAALVRQIKVAVADYVEALARSADPFVAAAPATVRMHQWAVIYDGTGFQTSHRHPSGWISGVYYVVAPVDRERGALLLGAPQQKVDSPPPWGILRIVPEPGRLVLFPSFVPHATEPCGADGQRICVAFDIMPANAPW